jgi:hypothetical protein
MWDVATQAEVARLHGHASYVFSLAFSPDGATLASGSGDNTVRLWDTKPLAERVQCRQQAEALRPQAEQLIESLFRKLKEPAEVARALRTDPAAMVIGPLLPGLLPDAPVSPAATPPILPIPPTSTDRSFLGSEEVANLATHLMGLLAVL